MALNEHHINNENSATSIRAHLDKSTVDNGLNNDVRTSHLQHQHNQHNQHNINTIHHPLQHRSSQLVVSDSNADEAKQTFVGRIKSCFESKMIPFESINHAIAGTTIEQSSLKAKSIRSIDVNVIPSNTVSQYVNFFEAKFTSTNKRNNSFKSTSLTNMKETSKANSLTSLTNHTVYSSDRTETKEQINNQKANYTNLNGELTEDRSISSLDFSENVKIQSNKADEKLDFVHKPTLKSESKFEAESQINISITISSHSGSLRGRKQKAIIQRTTSAFKKQVSGFVVHTNNAPLLMGRLKTFLKENDAKSKRFSGKDASPSTNWLHQYSKLHSKRSKASRKVENVETNKDDISDEKSWRRKAVYWRRNSLEDYFQRNFAKIDVGDNSNSMAKFMSTFPWRTFVNNSKNATKLHSLSDRHVKLFESMFEIIVSEKTYLQQLERLKSFTAKHPQLQQALSQYDHNMLFGTVEPIYRINSRLFHEIADGFQSNVFMCSLFETLSKYLGTEFEPYIDYIKAQTEQTRLINEESLNRIVPNITTLGSLVITPMQRITRYPILLDNILKQMDKIVCTDMTDSDLAVNSKNVHFDLNQLRQSAVNCLEISKQFALKCNNALDDQKHLYELIQFRKKLTGKIHIPDFVKPKRRIVQQVNIKIHKQINWNSDYNDNREFKAKNLTLVLITDMMLLAEYKARKDKYILIECEKLDQVEFYRNCSSEEDNQAVSASALTTGHVNSPYDLHRQQLCTIKFIKSKLVIYQLSFSSSEEEEKVFNQFKTLKMEMKDVDSFEPHKGSLSLTNLDTIDEFVDSDSSDSANQQTVSNGEVILNSDEKPLLSTESDSTQDLIAHYSPID